MSKVVTKFLSLMKKAGPIELDKSPKNYDCPNYKVL